MTTKNKVIAAALAAAITTAAPLATASTPPPPGTITWNPSFHDHKVPVRARNGANWNEYITKLALLGCNASRTRCLVQDINPKSRNNRRVGWANGHAIYAD